MNFTPAYVHQLNDKTFLLQERKALKKAARERRAAYWLNLENSLQDRVEGGYSGMNQGEIVDYRANVEGVLEGGRSKTAPFPY